MIAALTDFISAHPKLVVITGAGLSTASGIPAYRDQKGTWLRTTPIQHNDFIKQLPSRQRYWARSMVGWPRMQEATPNEGHLALVKMEAAGLIDLLITQNVDCLHQRAGHKNLIDLHGSLDRVICLQCHETDSREAVQRWLEANNPELRQPLSEMKPDGDADIADTLIANITVPDCQHCGGVLKPDVVFFGGTVPRDRVEKANTAITDCDGLLVIGSSLKVFSGFRFCRNAHALGKPIACLTQGETRADELIDLKVEEDCAQGLSAIAKQLGL